MKKEEDLSGFWDTNPKQYKAWNKTEDMCIEYIKTVVLSLIVILLAFFALLISGG